MHVVFLHQEARLDTPAIARAEVTALMNVVAVERTAGEPGMASGFGDDFPLLIHGLPRLVTDDDMDAQAFSAGLGEFIVDGIDPGEGLATLAPSAA